MNEERRTQWKEAIQEDIEHALPQLLEAIMGWCKQSGDMPIKDKVWHWDFGEWEVVINATLEVVTHTTHQGHSILIEPGHFKFEYNGFPAGDLDLMGNGWFAAGKCANMETCAAAIRKATDDISGTDDTEADDTGTDDGSGSEGSETS